MQDKKIYKNTLDFLTIFILALGGLFVVGQLYLPLPLLGKLQNHYENIHYSQTLLVSAFGIAYAFGFLVFGTLADQIGKKKVMVFGLIFLTLCTIYIGFEQNPNLVLIARVLQGFLAASFPPVALAYISSNIQTKFIGLAISAMAFAFLSAVALAQVFVILLSANNLQIPEQIIAVFYIFLLVSLVVLLQKDSSKNKFNLAKFLIMFKNLPSLFFDKKLFKLYLISSTILFIFVGFYLVLMNLLNTQTSNISSLSLRLWTLPFFLAGFFSNRLIAFFKYTNALKIVLSLSLIALLLAIVSFYIQVFNLMFIALCILSSAMALLVPILITCVAINAQNEQKTSAVALYTFVLFCGASLSPPVFDFFIQNLGVSFALLFMFCVNLISFFISLLKN